MQMHNPPHPGEILKTLCLEPSQYDLWQAEQHRRELKVSRLCAA